MQTQKQTAPVQGKVAWLWVCKARPPRETVSNRKSWPKARHVAVAASRARSKLGRTKRDPRAWQDGRGPLVRALGLDCPKPARSSAHAQNGPAAEASNALSPAPNGAYCFGLHFLAASSHVPPALSQLALSVADAAS
jgi:hypothetical protein